MRHPSGCWSSARTQLREIPALFHHRDRFQHHPSGVELLEDGARCGVRWRSHRCRPSHPHRFAPCRRRYMLHQASTAQRILLLQLSNSTVHAQMPPAGTAMRTGSAGCCAAGDPSSDPALANRTSASHSDQAPAIPSTAAKNAVRIDLDRCRRCAWELPTVHRPSLQPCHRLYPQAYIGKEYFIDLRQLCHRYLRALRSPPRQPRGGSFEHPHAA